MEHTNLDPTAHPASSRFPVDCVPNLFSADGCYSPTASDDWWQGFACVCCDGYARWLALAAGYVCQVIRSRLKLCLLENESVRLSLGV
jgi:hypothetical protein